MMKITWKRAGWLDPLLLQPWFSLLMLTLFLPISLYLSLSEITTPLIFLSLPLSMSLELALNCLSFLWFFLSSFRYIHK